MKPTLVERLILSNQYRILESLYPKEKKAFESHREIIEGAFESLYPECTGHITKDEEAITKEIATEVHDVLTMFEALWRAHKTRAGTSPIGEGSASFDGFDNSYPTLDLQDEP